MQLYQFERIYSQMEKEFGKIQKGHEEDYAMLLFPLEGNVLKVHRVHPDSHSRRLREAIALVLFDIKSHYTKEEYDIAKFRNVDNERLENALLMAFDPFSNEEIKEVVKDQLDETDEAQLREYYKVPIMCLLRIKDSIDVWEKRSGSDGYFLFIEEWMGSQVNGTKMEFSVLL